MKYNLIIGIILMILSYMIGLELSKKYTKRRLFFSDFDNFNQLLISEISFTKASIPEIIKKNKRNNSLFFKILEDKYIFKINDFTKENFLSNKDWDFLINYLNNIGKANGKMCLDYLKGAKERLKTLLKDAQMDENKKRPLIIKVSFMIGLILLIAFL